jgi:GAG-pre-integrase domain
MKHNIIDNDEEIYEVHHTTIRNEKEILLYREKLGHMSFKLIQHAATNGILPKSLAKCKSPICPACLHGKMTRKLWRTSNTVHKISNTTTGIPGEFVSVDQMESGTPGLIAQMKGISTRERYEIATVFIDHATYFTFTHFQIDTSSQQTLRAKKEFERIARSHGVTIEHYYSDNDRFVDKSWRKDAMTKSKSMSLCGVNAHHQKGKVECQIRSLQDLSRSSLMHAIKC